MDAQESYFKDGRDAHGSDPLSLVLGQGDADLEGGRALPALRSYVEACVVADDGAVFLVGWADDRHDQLAAIQCTSADGRLDFGPSGRAREARADLTHLAGGSAGPLGFWCFDAAPGFSPRAGEPVTVLLTTAGGRTASQTVAARRVTRAAFRTTLLTYDVAGARAVRTEAEDACRAEVGRYLDAGAAHAPMPLDLTNGSVGSQIVQFEPAAKPTAVGPGGPRCGIDVVFGCADGAMLLVGWVDDSESPLDGIRVRGHGWDASIGGAATGRARRADVERELGTAQPHPFGFWSLVTGRGTIPLAPVPRVELTLADGSSAGIDAPPLRLVGAADLRDTALGYFANCAYHGASHVEAQAQLDGGLGQRIIALNRAVCRPFTASPYVQRFVAPGGRPRASFVVCLFGRAEFLFLQAAAFSRVPGFAADYEMVYVSNSPELAERLSNEARIAHRVFGVDITLVLLAGNAGFGAANNVAVGACRSGRVVFVNPDVFPDGGAASGMDWGCRHLDLIDERPPAETRLFGVPLYYGDGSMMHAGMYLEMDTGLSWAPGGVTARPMARVEHYAKGAPPGIGRYLASRPVPAVTGAFMSADRTWFETLGGFTEDYVFGHYEDADLCLKSLQRGTPAWLHDAGLMHLEGKGSVRMPAHEGGSTVNRWLFANTWLDTIRDGLRGPDPERLRPRAPEPRAAVTVPVVVPMTVPPPRGAQPRVGKRARAAGDWREAALSTAG